MMQTKVLDQGFVKLIDHMGNDNAIAEAARVSYEPGSTTKVRGVRELIRYLLRHAHTSPFEMVEFKFHVKMPIFVARQWIRHRTASLNEVSGRYSILKDEFFVPDHIRFQSETNKQGSGELLPIEESGLLIEQFRAMGETVFMHYNHLAKPQSEEGYGVARELARINLPLSTYTEFYWKIDLHNLLHFLKLRTDGHAQLEIRVFADAIAHMVEVICPVAYQAWVDYSKEAYTLSRMELEVLRNYILTPLAGIDQLIEQYGPEMGRREIEEFKARFFD